MLMITMEIVSEATLKAPEPVGTNQEVRPMQAGSKTEVEIIIIPKKNSLSTSLPSREEAVIVNTSRARVIATGVIRLLNWAT